MIIKKFKHQNLYKNEPLYIEIDILYHPIYRVKNFYLRLVQTNNSWIDSKLFIFTDSFTYFKLDSVIMMATLNVFLVIRNVRL